MAEDQKVNEDTISNMQQDREMQEEKLQQDKELEIKKLIQQKDRDCKESKKALLKLLNARYTQSTKDLTAEMTAKWKET